MHLSHYEIPQLTSPYSISYLRNKTEKVVYFFFCTHDTRDMEGFANWYIGWLSLLWVFLTASLKLWSWILLLIFTIYCLRKRHPCHFDCSHCYYCIWHHHRCRYHLLNHNLCSILVVPVLRKWFNSQENISIQNLGIKQTLSKIGH